MGDAVKPAPGPVAPRHLQNSPQFQAVMNAGVIATSPHFALHRLILNGPNDLFVPPGSTPGDGTAPAWIGVLLPKRHAKKAVRRNLLRRQIYAVASDAPHRLAGAAHVVRLRKPFDSKGFISANSILLKQAVRLELQSLFAKLTKAPSPLSV